MSFGIALSGLDAAQSNLNVTANNIANSATTGFKSSNAEFRRVVRGLAAGRQQHADRQRRATAASRAAVRAGQYPDHRQQPRPGAERQRLLHGEQRRRRCSTRAPAPSRPTATATWSMPQGQFLQVYAPTASGTFNTTSLTNLQIPTGDSAPSGHHHRLAWPSICRPTRRAPADATFSPDRCQQLQPVDLDDACTTRSAPRIPPASTSSAPAAAPGMPTSTSTARRSTPTPIRCS